MLGIVIVALVAGNGGTAKPPPTQQQAAAPVVEQPTQPMVTSTKSAEPSAESLRATQAADAFDKALKADAADVFAKALKLSALESTVHGTPSEAAWKKAHADAHAGGRKISDGSKRTTPHCWR